MPDQTTAATWSVWGFVDKITSVTLLTGALYLGSQGYWVWGQVYRDAQAEVQVARKERDEYRTLFMKAAHIADSVQGVGMAPPLLQDLKAKAERLDESIAR